MTLRGAVCRGRLPCAALAAGAAGAGGALWILARRGGTTDRARLAAEVDELGGEPRDRVAQVDRAGRHLLGLINEVLDISRIEVGQIALSPEPVELGPVVDETLELVGGLCERFGVEIAAAVPDDHWAKVDRQRFVHRKVTAPRCAHVAI